jgi:hypothetical protein
MDTHAQWAPSGEAFEVDYEQPVLAVFKKFLASTIQKSRSLDIICRPWAPTSGYNAKGIFEKIDLPSWIASLLRKPFQPTKDGNMVRYNPDPLVGPSVWRHKLYSASADRGVICTIDLQDDYSKKMTVKGFVLSEIDEIWDCAAFGNVPANWLKAAGWENEDDPPPDELWRTLVADRNEQGYDPDRWYPSAFQTSAKDRGLAYGFETYRQIHEIPNQHVNEVFRRVQAVVWNRRLIRTTGLPGSPDALGALGLAPNEAKKGDFICIIFGCSVPLVLRREIQPKRHTSHHSIKSDEVTLTDVHEDSNDASSLALEGSDDTPLGSSNARSIEEQFILVGECYVDHMMDGEAMHYLAIDERLESEFAIF